MSSRVRLLRDVLARAIANFALDFHFLRVPFVSRADRVRFLGEKYAALVRGRRSIQWFGRPFAYDNQWTPTLLQHYPQEIGAVLDASELPARPLVLDIGANVGQFAATLLGAVPAARVWSFEPNPEPLELLRRNAGSDDRWKVVPFGVGAADAELDFFFVGGKSSQGSVHAENATLGLLGGEATKVSVPIRRLTDERRAEYDVPAHFDLVKIDVEGAERDALAGLAGVTWRNLLIELSVGRAGAMTRDELLDLCRRQWGSSVAIHRVLTSNDQAEELVLRAGGDAD